MTKQIHIRVSEPTDVPLIEGLYPDAFPDEDLLPVVKELLQQSDGVLSLVAIAGTNLVGNVIFTRCNIAGIPEEAFLMAPLAVASSRQRQGIGSALVRAGLERLRRTGTNLVFVLGDPNYYGRFGFLPDVSVAPPYALPQEWQDAWQSLTLGEDTSPVRGQLLVPDPWRRPELWTP